MSTLQRAAFIFLLNLKARPTCSIFLSIRSAILQVVLDVVRFLAHLIRLVGCSASEVFSLVLDLLERFMSSCMRSFTSVT